MTEPQTAATGVDVEETVVRVRGQLEDAIAANRPLEIQPYRDELFRLFSAAFTAGMTGEDGPLGSDELARLVGRHWNLDESAKLATADQTKFKPEDVARLRALWSLLRMWMEWDFAWHQLPSGSAPTKPR